jgi:opacity protein-like surface antigen
LFLKIAILAMLSAASSAAAQGFDEPHWYGALDVGAHFPGQIDSRSTGNAPDGKPYDWQWKFRDDWAVGGRIGYRFAPHLRVEGEVQFQHTDVTSVHAPGPDAGGFSASRPGEPWGLCAAPPAGGRCAPASGSNTDITAVYTGTANVIYDVWPDRRIDPFVGAGVGITHIEMLTTYAFSGVPGPITPTNPAAQTLKLAGTLTRPGEFAVQGLAGVSYRLARRLHMDLTYRYAFTPGELRWNPVNNTAPGLPQGGGLRPGDFMGRFSDQSVTLGLRYAY